MNKGLSKIEDKFIHPILWLISIIFLIKKDVSNLQKRLTKKKSHSNITVLSDNSVMLF